MKQKIRLKNRQTENKYLKFLKEEINLVIFTTVCFIFISYRASESICLNLYGITSEAIIINERNYYPNSPVSHEFSYSYKFKVNDKSYYGDSHDSDFTIGETVMIEYVPFYPDFNKIAKDELPDYRD